MVLAAGQVNEKSDCNSPLMVGKDSSGHYPNEIKHLKSRN